MAVVCQREAANGQPSKLFQQLYEIVGDELVADRLYAYFKSDAFNERFYPDVEGVDSITRLAQSEELENRVDENGEPILFRDEISKKYYFLDKNGEAVYYPFERTGLGRLFSVNDIKSYAKILAIGYHRYRSEFDFEKMDFTDKDIQSPVSLEEYVEQQIRDNVEQIKDDYAYFHMAPLLETSLEHMDEWIAEINAFYSTVGIRSTEPSHVEPNEEEDEVAEETHGDDLIRKESFLKNAKDSVRSTIKLFIAGFQTDEPGNFGINNFVDFNEVYNQINRVLNSIVPIEGEDVYDTYMRALENLFVIDPVYVKIHALLTSDVISDAFKNQFVAAFNLHRNAFITTVYNQRTGSFDIIDASVLTNRRQNIINGWQIQLDDLRKDPAEFRLAKRAFKDATNPIEALSYIGINITQEQWDEFVRQNPNNAATLMSNLENYILNKGAKLDTQTIVKSLAEVVSYFVKDGTDASVRSGGKSKWVYSLPSYLDLKVGEWKSSRQELENQYNGSAYNQGSYYMAMLLALDVAEKDRAAESQRRIEAVRIGIFNTLAGANSQVDNKNISEFDMLLDYFHKILQPKLGIQGWAKTALPGDKSTEYLISMPVELFVSTNAKYDKAKGRVVVANKVSNIFYRYFEAEYNRMREAHEYLDAGGTPIKGYHYQKDPSKRDGNAFKSQLFPALSTNEVAELYSPSGRPIANLKEHESAIKEHIKQALSDYIIAKGKTLREAGVLEHIDKNLRAQYPNDNQGELAMIADFVINSTISLIEYSKMFSGDLAYYKNKDDYTKRGSAPYTDGIYTPRTDKPLTIAVIESVEIPVPDMDNLRKTVGPEIAAMYEENNSADAQAWITPQRWKEIMIGIGKWNSEMDALYEKLFQGNPTFTPKELKTLAQPLKGVYFNLDQLTDPQGNSLGYVPVYLKYSQAVLLPNLIKGTQLELVYDKMQEQGIDELITIDGVKVGSYVPQKIHDDAGYVVPDFELIPQVLDGTKWKLQQQLATKQIKDTNVGSQIQKNIFAGLMFKTTETFDINGTEMSGEEVIAHINSLYASLSDAARAAVEEKLGIAADGTITNLDAMYNSLIEQLEKRGDVPANTINALRAKMPPMAIPGFYSIFSNIFASMLDREILKYKSNGGEFIQMSDFGLTSADLQQSADRPSKQAVLDKAQADLDNNLKNMLNLAQPGLVFEKLTNDQLVEADDPIKLKQAQEEFNTRLQEFNDLINCLWHS